MTQDNNIPVYGITPLTLSEVNKIDKYINANFLSSAFSVGDKIAVVALTNHQALIVDMESNQNYISQNYISIQARNLNKMAAQLLKCNEVFEEAVANITLGMPEAADEVETEYNRHSAVCNFTVSLENCCDIVIRDHEEQVNTAGCQITFPAKIGEHLALALMLTRNAFKI